MSTVKAYQEKFENLQTRERVLVLVVFLALIYMLWSLAFGSKINSENRQLQRLVSELKVKLDAQNLEIQSLRTLTAQDPDRILRQELAQLVTDIEKVDQSLAAMSVGLVPAKELPLILEKVLLQTGKLALVSLQTLPIEELQLSIPVENAASTPATGVYRHSVLLTLRGAYFSLNDYLLALEQLPWRFYWDSLDYHVGAYPQADITLKVYTLSTERGVIGG